MKPANFDQLVQRYLAGEPPGKLGPEVGVTGHCFYIWLRKSGIKPRGYAEAGIARTREVRDALPKIIRRYCAGESITTLAAIYQTNRPTLSKLLRENNVQMRTDSENEILKWSRMSPEQRERQVRVTHEALRGRVRPFKETAATANSVYIRRKRIQPIEDKISAALRCMEIPISQQFPVGGYNVDIALHGHPIAVEIERNRFAGGKVVWQFRKRLKYILNQGWSVLYVYGKVFDIPEIANKIISWFELTSRDESTRGKYGMVDRCPKLRSKTTHKFDGLTRVKGF